MPVNLLQDDEDDSDQQENLLPDTQNQAYGQQSPIVNFLSSMKNNSGYLPSSDKDAVKIAGSMALGAAVPEAGLAEIPAIGSALEGASPLAKTLGQAASRIAPQVGLNIAFDPKHPLNAAMGGLAMGSLGEAIPLALKGISKGAEYLNPKEFTNQLADKIYSGYQNVKKETSNIYNPILQKYGFKNIYENPGNLPDTVKGALNPKYSDLSQETIKDYFTPKLQRLNKAFMSDPNVSNAHSLQSELFKASDRVRGFQLKNPSEYNTKAIESFDFARELLKNDLKNGLANIDPQAANDYGRASDITRDIVSHYRRDPLINKIANGQISNVEPQKLSNSLDKVSQLQYKRKFVVPREHPLVQTQPELAQKISSGKTAQSVIKGAGGIAGLFGGHEFLPGIVGDALGAALGHAALPGAIKLVQSDKVKDLAKNLAPYYNQFRKMIVPSAY